MGKKKDEFKEKVLDYLIAVKEMYGSFAATNETIQDANDRFQNCLEECIRDIEDENLGSEDSWS
jgi:predicted RNase H-like HicB family nuclease